MLDIGSGHNPHPRADVLLDKELGRNVHRSGEQAKITKDRIFVIADAQNLPFNSAAFDYAIALHIAEHLDDPEAFCQEVVRVSKRGYIETPGKLSDLFLSEFFHKWYVDVSRSSLVFRRKQNTLPVSETFYRLFYYDIERVGHRKMAVERIRFLHSLLKGLAFFLRKFWSLSKRLTYTRFQWKQSFDFEIIDTSC